MYREVGYLLQSLTRSVGAPLKKMGVFPCPSSQGDFLSVCWSVKPKVMTE